jgi:ATP-dependent Clp protease ATP-binding subunit ClpA
MPQATYELSGDVQRAVRMSQSIAAELGHANVELEDLFLAALRTDLVVRALATIPVDSQALAERLLHVAARGADRREVERRYSSRAGRAMMRLWEEAKGLEQSYADTLCMLLALLRPPPRRFMFVFPPRVPPLWQEVHRAGVDRQTVTRAARTLTGAA